jgi:6-pyruvoyltetrahydropterin/6-carboxytetrahydropterin synthase
VFEVFIETSISSAHRLDGYPGPCSRVHGHNWKITASVSCEELDERGFGIDFRALKAHLEEICAGLDHRDLNRLEFFRGLNPTAENLARYIFKELSLRINNPRVRVSRIEVGETSESGAAYRE